MTLLLHSNGTRSALTPTYWQLLKTPDMSAGPDFPLPCFHAIQIQQSLTAIIDIPDQYCTMINSNCKEISVQQNKFEQSVWWQPLTAVLAAQPLMLT